MVKVPDSRIEELYATLAPEHAFEKAQRVVSKLSADGFAANATLKKLAALVIADGALSDVQKAAAAKHLANSDKQIVNGAEEWLQIMSCAAALRLLRRGATTLEQQ